MEIEMREPPIQDENEGWNEPVDSSLHHYFIREKGTMFGKSLCGKFRMYTYNFWDKGKDGNSLDIKFCQICNDMLIKKLHQSNLSRFI